MENISRTLRALIEKLSSWFQARFKHELFTALLIEWIYKPSIFLVTKKIKIHDLFNHILRSCQALINQELFIEKTANA
jgi:hypothetical protein